MNFIVLISQIDLLGWQSVYAYNNEDFRPKSLLGRASDRGFHLPRLMNGEIAV